MNAVFSLIRRAFRREEPLHPIDRQMAKRFIKQRLVVVYPELRNNPKALERAYQALSLEVRDGKELGEEGTVFEAILPGDLPEP